MSARKRIYLCMLSLALAASAWGDSRTHLRTTSVGPYLVTYWTSEQGLPQNTVTSMKQTWDGYLWIGTRCGIARYDGARFTDYTAELSGNGDDDLDVRGLTEDNSGRLWLRCRKNLVSYHDARFTRYSLTNAPFAGAIEQVCSCRTGGVWVGCNQGVFQFEGGRVGSKFGVGKELVSPFENEKAELNGLTEAADGKVWVLLASGGRSHHWQQIDPATGQVLALSSVVGSALVDVQALFPDAEGRLWLARPGELLCWKSGALSRFDASGAWGSERVREVVGDSFGNLWVLSSGPVQLHRFTDGEFASFGPDEGLSRAEDIRSLWPDREGNLWLGTGGNGLFQLQPRALVSMLSGSASALHEIYSIAPGREGGAWLATSYGLINYRAGDLAVYTNFAGLGSDDFKRVRTVWEHSSGQVFLGIDFDGLHQMRDGSFLPVAGIPPVYNERRMVTSLSEDRQGVLWIASAAGLAQYREGVCRLWTRANGLSDNRTFGLACAADDSVWVGTESGGVNQFKEGHFCVYSTTNGLLSQNAWPLRAEPDGSVWVGTPVGLNLIRKDKISSVTMREGLFDNLLYCLLEDSRGNYWTFGNRGIWRVKKDELRAVADRRAARVYCVNYGEANGMASAEGNGDEQPNAAALPNGELWFPTTRGVVILNPETLRENRIPPPVVIEEVRVDDQVVFRDGGFPAASAVFQQPESLFLRLPPGRARTLEIRYTANTFIDSEKTRFRFRLHGNHGEWREADTRRVAVYTNLRPGAYRFAVEACNHHGYWSERPAEFAFELAPYFYETWPFCVCCGLVSCGCLVGWGVRRGVVRQRWERLQRAGALEAERNRIARDLHDDLGANLTSLALQIELGSGQVDSTVPSSQERQALAGAIRGVAARVREVVWSINPKCDTLESFCAYLCHYAEGFLAAAGLRCRLDFPEEQQAQPLSAEARHQLLLFVKEALNNVAKHAQANEVCLGVGLQPDGLSLTVADDGRGFCPQRKDGMHAQPAARETGAAAFTAGHGLSNMRRRIEALGGTLEVASEPGKGTRITARLPMPESATTSPSSI